MKKLIMVVMAMVLTAPMFVFAHEHQVYKIGDKTYTFGIGSLNEPLIVDDKSGLDLTVTEGVSGKAVEGLETTLKVEMIAGDTKRTMGIKPAWGTPGKYVTTFYPTVQTTFTYRLFGTINDVPVDLPFTCNAGGHGVVPDDNNPVEVSEGVVKMSKSGAFGCAEAKADFGFPEPAKASAETPSSNSLGSITTMSVAALALSVLAVSRVWRKK